MSHDGRKRKSPEGRTTGNLICSAHVGTSEELVPRILERHVPPGSTIADVTYGKGIFWKRVPKGACHVLGTDMANGVDCRNLPYHSGSADCVVLDPPYMEGFFRRATAHMAGAGTYAAFRSTHSSGEPATAGPKCHEAALDLYIKAGKEAHRVLRPYGTLIVKRQDEDSANVQHLTHVDIVVGSQSLGFYAKDLLVLIRPNKPAASRVKRQRRARKNHSYFPAFIKTDGGSPRRKHA